MKFILDASTALKWVLNEPNSDKALALREEYRQHVNELLAPDTFVVEVAHALTKAERRRAIRVGEAIVFLGDIMSTRPDLEPVALAEREACKIVTDDQRLLKTFAAHTIALSSL
jgi:predicted nucleic acid-binding protein